MVPAGTPVLVPFGKPVDDAVVAVGVDEDVGLDDVLVVGVLDELVGDDGEVVDDVGDGLAVTVVVAVAVAVTVEAGGSGTVQTTLIWDPALTWVTVGAEVHDAVWVEVVAAWTTAKPPTSTRPVAVAATTPSRRRDKEIFMVV